MKILGYALAWIVAFSITDGASGAYAMEPTSADVCASNLEAISEVLMRVDEIVAFLSFVHPIQLEQVEKNNEATAILFWVHWSCGFQASTQPTLYRPKFEDFVLGLKKRALRFFVPSLDYLEGHLKGFPINDDFPRYLRQDRWDALLNNNPRRNIRRNKLDHLMELQANQYETMSSVKSWRLLSESSRTRIIDDILAGVLEGLDVARGITTKRAFLYEAPADFHRKQHESLESAVFFLHLEASLKNPEVVRELHNFLNKHLPTLIRRRDDFHLSDPNIFWSPNHNPLSNMSNGELIPLRRHLLRPTPLRQTIEQIRREFIESRMGRTTAEPVAVAKSYDLVEPPVQTLMSIETQAREIPKSLTEVGNLALLDAVFDRARMSEQYLFQIINLSAQMKSLPGRLDMVKRLEALAGQLGTSTWKGDVSDLVASLKNTEESYVQEAKILIHLELAFSANLEALQRAVSAISERFKLDPLTQEQEVSEAEHLQEVLATFVPTARVLEMRRDNTHSTIELLRAVIREAYLHTIKLNSISPAGM